MDTAGARGGGINPPPPIFILPRFKKLYVASGGYLSGGPVHRPGLVALARRSGGGSLPGGGGDLLQLALFITILCNRWGLRGWMSYIRNSGLCWSVTFRPLLIIQAEGDAWRFCGGPSFG